MWKYLEGARHLKWKRPWRKDGHNREEEELQDLEVYFATTFSSDKELEEVVERISCEWGQMNGWKLWLKTISSFRSMTSITIYHMLSSGHQKTIATEFTRILKAACDLEEEVEDAYQYGGVKIPEFTFCLNVPKIPSQDSSVFQSWSGQSPSGMRFEGH